MGVGEWGSGKWEVKGDAGTMGVHQLQECYNVSN